MKHIQTLLFLLILLPSKLPAIQLEDRHDRQSNRTDMAGKGSESSPTHFHSYLRVRKGTLDIQNSRLLWSHVRDSLPDLAAAHRPRGRCAHLHL